jgi:hypothetical protein
LRLIVANAFVVTTVDKVPVVKVIEEGENEDPETINDEAKSGALVSR